MIKTFTENDLIRFLYRETSDEESREIDKALLCDAELSGKLQNLQGLLQALDNASLEPSPDTVLNILSYSQGVPQAQR